MFVITIPARRHGQSRADPRCADRRTCFVRPDIKSIGVSGAARGKVRIGASVAVFAQAPVVSAPPQVRG